MRIVVVQPTRTKAGPLPSVGVLRWRDPDPTLTVIVKATFSFAEAGPAVLAPEQLPLTLGEPTEGSDDEVEYPSDFVPRRGAADVLLWGHAHADLPTEVIEASVAVGRVARRFQVVSEVPRADIALRAQAIRGAHGENGAPVRAARRLARPRADGDLSPDTGPRFYGPTFNYFAYNTAPPQQISEWIAPDAVVSLEGLSARGPFTFALPGLAPRVLVDAVGNRVAVIDLVCDTLWLDVDRHLGVMVWRGHAGVSAPEAPEVLRIIVSLEPHDAPAPEPELRRRAMRSRLSLAAEEEQLSPEPAGAEERDQIAMARSELWSCPAAPDPEISLAQYASLSAELAGARERRAETLARHDLDEHTWTLEERGWLEKMAGAASNGDPTMLLEYGALFAEAKRALGPARGAGEVG
jgi:hypothetical protein